MQLWRQENGGYLTKGDMEHQRQENGALETGKQRVID